MEARTGRAFVMMSRSMQANSEGWVASMSLGFDRADWTMHHVLRNRCHITHERGPRNPRHGHLIVLVEVTVGVFA
jgi:hypothetical protein